MYGFFVFLEIVFLACSFFTFIIFVMDAIFKYTFNEKWKKSTKISGVIFFVCVILFGAFHYKALDCDPEPEQIESVKSTLEQYPELIPKLKELTSDNHLSRGDCKQMQQMELEIIINRNRQEAEQRKEANLKWINALKPQTERE